MEYYLVNEIYLQLTIFIKTISSCNTQESIFIYCVDVYLDNCSSFYSTNWQIDFTLLVIVIMGTMSDIQMLHDSRKSYGWDTTSYKCPQRCTLKSRPWCFHTHKLPSELVVGDSTHRTTFLIGVVVIYSPSLSQPLHHTIENYRHYQPHFTRLLHHKHCIEKTSITPQLRSSLFW